MKRLLLVIIWALGASLLNGQAQDVTNTIVSNRNQLDAIPDVQEADKLLPLTRASNAKGHFDEIEKLWLSFLGMHPDDPKGLEYLGCTYIDDSKYDKAIPILQRSFDRGNPYALHWLFIANRASNTNELVLELIPVMLENLAKDPQLVDDLVTYSLQQRPPDKELFFKAVDGLSNEQIAKQHEMTFPTFIDGFECFGDFGRAAQLDAMKNDVRRAMERRFIENARRLDHSGRMNVIEMYEKYPSEVSGISLLTLATAYFDEQDYEKAKEIYERYGLFSRDDPLVFAGLATCYLAQTNQNEAIVLYRKAWRLGLTTVAPALATAYLSSTNNINEMNDLIPVLESNKSQNIIYILSFALKQVPADEKLFKKTVEGFSDQDLASNDNIANIVIYGFRLFGEKERAETIKNLKEAIKLKN